MSKYCPKKVKLISEVIKFINKDTMKNIKFKTKALIVISCLCIVGMMFYTYYVNHYSISYSETISDNIQLAYFYNSDDVAIRNSNTGEILGCYDECFTGYTKLKSAVVVKDGLRGYISTETGEVIFEPQFMYAWLDNGQNDLAACVNEEGKLGFVNIVTKEIAIPFQYDFLDSDFGTYVDYSGYEANGKFDFVFRNGLCLVPGENGEIGLIDETGKQVLPIKYTDIINWRDATAPDIILKSRDSAYYNYRYEIFDRNFKKIVSDDFQDLEKLWSRDEDYNIVLHGYMACKNDKWGIIDSSYKTIVPFQYDYMYKIHDFNFVVSKGGKRGIINMEGKKILPIEYNHIIEKEEFDYPDFIYRFIAIKNYKAMLFDDKGRIINDFYVEDGYVYDNIEHDYVKVRGFEAVCEPNTEVSSKYIQYCWDYNFGIIDGKKRVVIEAKYDKIEYLGHGNFVCKKDNQLYLIHDEQ